MVSLWIPTKGEREDRKEEKPPPLYVVSPLSLSLFPRPRSTTSLGNNVHLLLGVVVARGFEEKTGSVLPVRNPRNDGSLLLGYGLIKGASSDQ